MFDTPMRYPGGKGCLAQYAIDIIQMNGLTGGHYAEPFAGGAGIAITLLYLEYVERIHLNDINRSVFAFWKSVRDDPEGMCRLIRDTRLSMAEWRRQRAVQTAKKVSPLELGFSTLFLNRTNRSGIIGGGVIGGKNQDGPWKIDARFNRDDLIQRVQKIASYASRIDLYQMDGALFITEILPKLPRKSLVFLDPPYYGMRGSDLYMNDLKPEDHERLAGLIGRIKQKWIVTYDNVPQIRKLYRQFEQQAFALNYSAKSYYKGAEVMIFCPNLETPRTVVPWRGFAA